MSVCLLTWQQTRIPTPFLFYSSVIIFVFQNIQTNTVVQSASYSLSITTPPNKMEVEHSSKLSNKVKNKWSYALLCLMYKDNFTLHSYQQKKKLSTITTMTTTTKPAVVTPTAVSQFLSSVDMASTITSAIWQMQQVVKCADESHKFQYSWKCIFFPSFYGTKCKFTYVIHHNMHVKYSFPSTALHFHFFQISISTPQSTLVMNSDDTYQQSKTFCSNSYIPLCTPSQKCTLPTRYYILPTAGTKNMSFTNLAPQV